MITLTLIPWRYFSVCSRKVFVSVMIQFRLKLNFIFSVQLQENCSKMLFYLFSSLVDLKDLNNLTWKWNDKSRGETFMFQNKLGLSMKQEATDEVCLRERNSDFDWKKNKARKIEIEKVRRTCLFVTRWNSKEHYL